MKVSLIVFIFWLFSVFQRWTHYSFSSWKWVWKLFRGLKLWIHDSPTKCKTTIFVFHPPPTQHERLWVTLALILTNYQQSSVSGVDVRPVWLQGREDWIHALSKPLVGRCSGVGLHPFCFVVICLCPSLPPIFSLILVYFGFQHFISLH